MAQIIEFPIKKEHFGYQEIDEFSRQAVFEVFKAIYRLNKIDTLDTDFLRDMALVRKFLEAALLRQIGIDNTFVRILDDIFCQLPVKTK